MEIEEIKTGEVVEEPKKASGKLLPDYKGDGVAVWVFNKGTHKERLSIKIVGHDYIVAWVNNTNK